VAFLVSQKWSIFWFLEKCQKKWHFWTKIYIFHYLIGYHAFFYSTVSSFNWINVILDIFTWRLGTLWTVLQVSALQVKDFWRYLTTNLVVWTSRRLTHKLNRLSCSKVVAFLVSQKWSIFWFLEKCQKNDIFGPKYIFFTTW
jgi:hypothetical protein